MQRIPLVVGTVLLALGIGILAFAEGLRRYYSGLFFVVIGLVLLWRARDQGGAKRAD